MPTFSSPPPVVHTNSTLHLEDLLAVGAGSFFRPLDAEEVGGSYHRLTKQVERGDVEKIARGLFRLAEVKLTGHTSWRRSGTKRPAPRQESLDELRQAVHEWLVTYNYERPHQALAWSTPAERRAENLGRPRLAAAA